MAAPNTSGFYVYVYRDPLPERLGTPIYVGKGRGRRLWVHWHSGAHRNPLFNAILAKIRAVGLMPVVETVATFHDEIEAFSYEMLLIARYGRLNLGTGTLANLTDGGEGGSNPSSETRFLIGKGRRGKPGVNLGRIFSAEFRANNSAGQRRRGKRPAEFGAAISRALKGRPQSSAARAAYAAYHANRPPAHAAKLIAAARRPERNIRLGMALRAAAANNPRMIAKAEGRRRYFTGKPCSKGHITERYVDDGACLICSAAKALARYRKLNLNVPGQADLFIPAIT